jgi:hypothetical protein
MNVDIPDTKIMALHTAPKAQNSDFLEKGPSGFDYIL